MGKMDWFLKRSADFRCPVPELSMPVGTDTDAELPSFRDDLDLIVYLLDPAYLTVFQTYLDSVWVAG